jgi:hypothetical protein
VIWCLVTAVCVLFLRLLLPCWCAWSVLFLHDDGVRSVAQSVPTAPWQYSDSPWYVCLCVLQMKSLTLCVYVWLCSVKECIQVKKIHSDQYARVPKHRGSLFLFDPVIGLIELSQHFIEVKKRIPKREVTPYWRLAQLHLLYLYILWHC